MPGITESEFLDQVIQLAKMRGWYIVHFRPAKTASGWRTAVQGDVGWPDLFAVRGAECWAAELKVGTRRATDPQIEWLLRLEAAGIRVFIWRPEDWPQIEAVLAHGPGAVMEA